MTGSSGRQRVPVSCFNTFKIIKPRVEILEHFGLIAGDSLAKMKANVDESRILSSLRNSLLPKLLSGEIRVGQAQKLLAEAA